MRHLLYGQKSIFLGDEATDALVDYAALVAQLRTGARVDLKAYTEQGHLVDVTFLLNGAVDLVAESTDLRMPEPDNAAAVAGIRARLDEFAMSPDVFDPFGPSGGAETAGQQDV
jgi:hypothetical protein